MKALSENLTDRIIWALENQAETFFLDTRNKELVSLEKNPDLLPDQDPARFWPLPLWRPSDGFQLMKQFVEGLNNPVYKPRLEEVLSSGQGVFRKFKEVLRENRELERKWIAYKEKEFRKMIADWFSRSSGAEEGLALPYPDPDEEPDPEILLSDFTIIRETGGNLALFEDWDRAALQENTGPDNAVLLWFASKMRVSDRPLSTPNEVIFTANDPSGLPVGFLWMAALPDTGSLILQQLYIIPEFRSLGLGKLLLRRGVRHCREQKKAGPYLLTGPGASFLNRSLEEDGWELSLTLFSCQT